MGQDAAIETVLDNLHRPCGLAARPGGTADRYEMFIAESGAGRVVRWSNLEPDRAAEAITGFASNAASEPWQQTGPLALVFLDAGLLVVGTTADRSTEMLRSYELPEADAVLTAGQANNTPADGADADSSGEAACLALTRSRANEFVPDMLVAAVRGDDRGRLVKVRVQAGILGNQQPFGSVATPLPLAVATSGAGRIVVAAERLTFCNPIDGSVELQMPLDLRQPTSLAYSPTTGSLYAADFAGGVWRIDDASEASQPACRVVRVADVRRPTALAFSPDGALYVVTFGTGNDGTLQVVTGDL
jgi:hypothetical protein